MMRRHFILLWLVLVAGCSPRSEPMDSASTGSASLDSITGTVRVVGSAPVNVQVVIATADGRNLRVTGPLRAEIERLSGLPVTVRGRIGRSADPLADAEVDVAAYDIGLVNGRQVVVGEIIQQSGQQAQLRTDGGEVIYLSGAPGELRVGQKIWVQGPSTVVVQSYGVLRP